MPDKDQPDCIVCGKSITGEHYVGEIDNMDVVFCEEHKNYCDNCSVYDCQEDGSCHLLKEKG